MKNPLLTILAIIVIALGLTKPGEKDFEQRTYTCPCTKAMDSAAVFHNYVLFSVYEYDCNCLTDRVIDSLKLWADGKTVKMYLANKSRQKYLGVARHYYQLQ
jgi:hypothetical protein